MNLQRSSSHSTVVPTMRTKGSATPVCQSWGLFNMRLFSVSRIFLQCQKGYQKVSCLSVQAQQMYDV